MLLLQKLGARDTIKLMQSSNSVTLEKRGIGDIGYLTSAGARKG